MRLPPYPEMHRPYEPYMHGYPFGHGPWPRHPLARKKSMDDSMVVQPDLDIDAQYIEAPEEEKEPVSARPMTAAPIHHMPYRYKQKGFLGPKRPKLPQ